VGMGIRLKLGTGKELELTPWEWEEWECKTQFPVTVYIEWTQSRSTVVLETFKTVKFKCFFYNFQQVATVADEAARRSRAVDRR